MKSRHQVMLSLAALAALSCGGGKGSTGAANGTEGTSPAVVLGVDIESPEGRQIYVGAFPSAPTGLVSTQNMAEFGNVYMSVFGTHLYVFDRDSYEIIKFAFTDDLKMINQGRLSFASYGSGFEFGNAFLSEDLAIIPHAPSQQMIKWSPRTMTIVGTLPLALPVREGMDTYPSDPVVAGGHVVWPLISSNESAGTLYPTMAALIAPADGSASPTVIEDARCLPALQLFKTSNGDLYLFGDGYSGDSNFWIKEKAPPSCVLRIKAGESTFDPSYLLNINEATGSKALVQTFRVDDSRILVRVFDPAVPFPTRYEDFRTTKELVAKIVDVKNPTAAAVDYPFVPKGGATSNIQTYLDGVSYLEVPNADGSRVQEFRLTASALEPAFEVPGGLWVFGRVR